MNRSIVGVRFAVLLLAASVLVAAPLGVPGTATASSRHLAPSGSDSGSCTASAPCRSLSRAYRLAAPGQTVELAGGTYSDTSLPLDSTKRAARDVVFAPAAGARPKFSAPLHIAARNVELRGLQLQDTLHIDETAQNVTLRGLAIKNFQVFSSGTRAPRNISVPRRQRGPVGGRQQPHRVQRDVDDRVADQHPHRRYADP